MTTLTAEAVADLLRETGYRAQVSSEQLVLSGTNGFKFGVFVDSDGWIQCRLSLVRRPGREVDPAACNKFNYDYRFAKLFLDDDKDTNLSADFFIGRDAAAEATQAAFRASMDVWDTSVGSFRRFLDNVPAPAAAPAEAVG